MEGGRWRLTEARIFIPYIPLEHRSDLGNWLPAADPQDRIHEIFQLSA